MSLHISIGITILALIVLRFVWRLAHPVAPESYLPAWQRINSEAIHWLLVVLVATLTGWFFESARGWSVSLYGVLPLLRLVPEGSSIGHAIGELHETMIWVLVTFVVIHILAVFVHLFVYKDRVMHRMLPG